MAFPFQKNAAVKIVFPILDDDGDPVSGMFSFHIPYNTCTVLKTVYNVIDGADTLLFAVPALATGFYSNQVLEATVTEASLICFRMTAPEAGGSGKVGFGAYSYLQEYLPTVQPYVLRVQGIPGMRTFSQLGHGGL